MSLRVQTMASKAIRSLSVDILNILVTQSPRKEEGGCEHVDGVSLYRARQNGSVETLTSGSHDDASHNKWNRRDMAALTKGAIAF